MWIWLWYGFLAWGVIGLIYKYGPISMLQVAGLLLLTLCVGWIIDYNAKGALSLIGVRDENLSSGIGCLGGLVFFWGVIWWSARKRGPFRK